MPDKEPLLAQVPIKDACVALKSLSGLLDDRSIGWANIEDLLHETLESQRHAAVRAKMSKLPALPAGDISTHAGIVGPQRICRSACEILHNCRRFPKCKIAIDKRWRPAGRIEDEIRRRTLLPLAQVHNLQFEFDTEL